MGNGAVAAAKKRQRELELAMMQNTMQGTQQYTVAVPENVSPGQMFQVRHIYCIPSVFLLSIAFDHLSILHPSRLSIRSPTFIASVSPILSWSHVSSMNFTDHLSCVVRRHAGR